MSYVGLYRSEPLSRIEMAVRGLPAVEARRLLDIAPLERGAILAALELPAATFNRKVRASGRLSVSEGERVIGFACLVGQVEAMVGDAGGAEGFDAPAWLARWISEPLPALGNARPLELMRTMEGQAIVSAKLAQVGSGAYA